MNTETAVAADNRELAAALKRAINAHQQLCWPIGPDGRPAPDAAGYPGISLKKRLKVCLLRMSLPLIWNQL